MMMYYLVLSSLALLSTLIRVMVLNSRISSKNIATGRLIIFAADSLFLLTIIFKPINFWTVITNSLFMGLYSSLAFEMTGFCQNIRNLESQLESKARDINSAEAKTISMRKQSEELVLERDRLLESSGTRIKQLESEIETKTRDIGVAEDNATTIKKQLEELLLEYDVLLERNQNLTNESESYNTAVEELESELETRTKYVNIAQASAATLKNQLEELLFDYDVLLGRNQSLRNQSDSLNTRVKELESELETRTKDVNIAEANNISLRKQLQERLLENDRLSQSNQVLNNQLQSSGTTLQQLESELQTKKNEANAAEAKFVALRMEKQVLNIQLESSSNSHRRAEYELENNRKNVTTAAAKIVELRKQLDNLRYSHDHLIENNLRLKNQLDSMCTQSTEASLTKENQSLRNQLQSLKRTLEEVESAGATTNALLKENQCLKNQLQSLKRKLEDVESAGSTTEALGNENQSLRNQLQSLKRKLEEVESAGATTKVLGNEIQSLRNQLQSLKRKLEQVESAEATLRKENEKLKNQLQPPATKSVNEAKASSSAAEKFGKFLFDQF